MGEVQHHEATEQERETKILLDRAERAGCLTHVVNLIRSNQQELDHFLSQAERLIEESIAHGVTGSVKEKIYLGKLGDAARIILDERNKVEHSRVIEVFQLRVNSLPAEDQIAIKAVNDVKALLHIFSKQKFGGRKYYEVLRQLNELIENLEP